MSAERILAPEGLTYNQYVALVILGQHPGITGRTLATALGVNVSQTAEAKVITRNITIQVTTEVSAQCPRGSFCNAGNKFACPINTYNDVEDATDVRFCKPCPRNSGTLAEAAASVADCVCDRIRGQRQLRGGHAGR